MSIVNDLTDAIAIVVNALKSVPRSLRKQSRERAHATTGEERPPMLSETLLRLDAVSGAAPELDDILHEELRVAVLGADRDNANVLIDVAASPPYSIGRTSEGERVIIGRREPFTLIVAVDGSNAQAVLDRAREWSADRRGVELHIDLDRGWARIVQELPGRAAATSRS